jgi:hypothetical protein
MRVAEERLAEAFEEAMEEHRKRWEEHRTDSKFLQAAKSRTERDGRYHSDSGANATTYTCPACNNEAVVFMDYDVDRGGNATGYWAVGLECYFCGLELYDQEQLDFIRLNDASMSD